MPAYDPTFTASPTFTDHQYYGYLNELTDFYRRQVANSGLVDDTISSSLNTLIGDLKTAGTWTKFHHLWVGVGNNIEAIITPLIVGSGYGVMVNNNFVYADKNGNSGLNNSGGTKSLITGIFPTILNLSYAFGFGVSAPATATGYVISARKVGSYVTGIASSTAIGNNTINHGNDGAAAAYSWVSGVGHYCGTGVSGTGRGYKNLSASPAVSDSDAFTLTPDGSASFAIFARNQGVNSPVTIFNGALKYTYISVNQFSAAEHLATATAFENFLDRQGEGLV